MIDDKPEWICIFYEKYINNKIKKSNQLMKHILIINLMNKVIK